MKLSVRNLAEYMECFDTVLNWIYEEWGHNNREFWSGWIKSSLSEHDIPQTYVVFYRSELVGTFSLWRCDLQSRQDLFPWLGGIVVEKKWRGQGIGLFIQNEAKKVLKNLGYRKAYLFTEMTGYYEKTGWLYIETGFDERNEAVRLYELNV